MTLMKALFEPNGRIRGRDYWLACFVLLGIALGIHAIIYTMYVTSSGMQSMMIASAFGMLMWLLIYPYFCIFGKRLHDTGASAWYFLLILLLYVIAGWILQTIVILPAMFGDDGMLQSQVELMEQMAEQGEAGAADFTEIMNSQINSQAQMMKRIYPWMVLVDVGITLATDAIVSVLKTDPNDNEYGPGPNDNTFN